nr:hypothetical protein BaRGS_012538 [Batillaria attramentaria]
MIIRFLAGPQSTVPVIKYPGINQARELRHLRLFKSNSDLKSLFQGFKDLKTDDELRSNEALENHATLVMTTLDDAITHIDNFDYVSEVLRKTGASHHRFEGFNSENFWCLWLSSQLMGGTNEVFGSRASF